MTAFVAQASIRILVPFEFETEKLVDPPVALGPNASQEDHDSYSSTLDEYHASLERVNEQRQEAARYAEIVISETLRNALAGEGLVMSVSFEEVRE